MVGILQKEFGWRQIFEQEGILYQVLNNIPDEYDYPIVINRPLDSNEITHLKKLLNRGIGIITDFANLKNIKTGVNFKPKRVNYLLNDNSDIFDNITAIDIQYFGYENIYQSDYDKSYIIAIPFNINQALFKTRNERKPFYYPSRKFPNEITAKVSKAAIRKLVINCIRKLYQKMNLNYCHLWYYPNQMQSAFTFRVDTDFGPAKTLQATLDLEDKTNFKFTYFINTKVHPILTDNIRDFQIHCYEHEVYKDYQKNYDNINKARTILEKSGIKPIGFVSPYGLWNENLAKAIEDNHLKYSSEFSLAYDDLPFFPMIENRLSNVLQIPIHPICIGRLLHAGLNKEQCLDYYKRYFQKQLQTSEPIFIYDHPHRIGQFPDTFYKILELAKRLPDIWLTNMTEFYHWWQMRLSALKQSQWNLEQDRINLKTSNSSNQLCLHIITPHQTETFIPLTQGIYNLQNLSYKDITKPIIDKTEIVNYPRLKSKRTKLKIMFYQIIDKILDATKG